jgi:hypothetical protein
MKKLSFLLVAMFLMPAAAHAYENNFMRMTTPSGWSVQEMKMPGAGDVVGGTAARSASSRLGDIPVTSGGGAAASAAIGAGVGVATDTAASGVGYGVMKGMMKGMPKFANATFSKGDAQIVLMVMEGQVGGAPSAGSGAGGGSGKSNCDTIENTSTNWGGQSAKVYTMACPQGREWMYTTTVTMNKGGAMYTLMGTMPAKSKDGSEFNSTLKPARDTILSSTSFK